MHKIFIISLLCCGIFTSINDNINTLSVVTLIGAKIKASQVHIEKKYRRKDCPVCEGKGWYISGDKIKKVDCGYCEPEIKLNNDTNQSKTYYHK